VAIVVSASIETSGAEAGARRFNAALSSMRGGVVTAGQAIAGLGRTLMSLPFLIASAGLAKLGKDAVSAGDNFLQLKARLGLVTAEGTSVESVLAGIGEAALRARVPVSELTQIYTKNANALKDLKFSQSDNLRLAETLAKAVKVSGVSGQEAAAAMLQLSQAISSGKFQGDEFRSVAENLPEVMRILQRETGKTAGELRKLAEEGKLTGKTLTQALLNASSDIDAKFAKMPKTAGEAASAAADAINLNFSKVAESTGLSAAWAAVFDQIREAASSPAMQQAFRLFAEYLKEVARNFSNLITFVGDARVAIAGWTKAIQETEAYKALASVIERLGQGFAFIKGAVFGAGEALAGAAAGAMPETAKGLADLAARAKQASLEFATLERMKGSIFGDNNAPLKPSEPKKAKVELGKGDTAGEIEKLKRLIQTEALQFELKKRAALEYGDVESDTTLNLRNQLDIHGKITKEMRSASPTLAKRLEAQIRETNELERQNEIMSRNRELGEGFARGITAAFREAAESGKGFAGSLRLVLARLIDMTTQTLILEPLVKSIGKGFSSWAGGTDVGGSIAKTLLGALGGAATGGVGSWATTVTPFANGGVVDRATPFAFGGGMGVAGEAGPEAILPLRRGADGKLGVAGGGGGGGNVSIVINGNPDNAMLAEVRRIAEDIVAARTPGIVKTSVATVASRHRADRNYLNR